MNKHSNREYKFAAEFTRFPGGRLREHGSKSGQEFREDVLIPLINEFESIHIDLTGAAGYSASFLDESFGELGKLYGLDLIKGKLKLTAEDDPYLIDIIWDKILQGSKEYKQR